MDLEKDLLTTVVGSYPATPTKERLQRSRFSDTDPFMESLEESVKAQLDSGIELVSDGQTRGTMTEIFAQDLRGYRIRDKVEIVSEVGYTGEITVGDAEEARKLLPEGTGLKGIITGPWTMVKSSSDKHYESHKEAVLDTAEALNQEAENLAKICDVVQLDEPFFSNQLPPYGKNAVEKVLDVDVPTKLHVCGDVTAIIAELVEIDVDILDHEFAANPQLYDAYGEIENPHRMSVGAVTTEPEVEGVETIKERIDMAYETFGPKTMIDPDCGLRNLKEEKARAKLKNMVKARDVVLDERS
ncbi:MAG: hypothetical protein KGY76_03065 [Candidatus Thermoplasmatota archaeon]|nr:hypothetical protein [Candidatus Thermoplasmatota archaeon]